MFLICIIYSYTHCNPCSPYAQKCAEGSSDLFEIKCGTFPGPGALNGHRMVQMVRMKLQPVSPHSDTHRLTDTQEQDINSIIWLTWGHSRQMRVYQHSDISDPKPTQDPAALGRY